METAGREAGAFSAAIAAVSSSKCISTGPRTNTDSIRTPIAVVEPRVLARQVQVGEHQAVGKGAIAGAHRRQRPRTESRSR